MTNEEKQFLLNLLGQVTLNAADPKAEETVKIIKSILNQLKIDLPTEDNKS